MSTKTDKKKTYESFVSPKGIAIWPKLTVPDTKFKEDGEYTVRLAYTPSDKGVQAFLDDLQARFDQFVEETKDALGPAKAKKLKLNDPFTEEADDEGNETGRVLVKFKANAQYKNKQGQVVKRTLRIFDAKGNPLASPPNIGNDSVLKISYSVGTYSTPQGSGITLYINAVQIVELVEYGAGGGDAKAYGFGEEDGYTSEAAKEGFGDESDADASGEEF